MTKKKFKIELLHSSLPAYNMIPSLQCLKNLKSNSYFRRFSIFWWIFWFRNILVNWPDTNQIWIFARTLKYVFNPFNQIIFILLASELNWKVSNLFNHIIPGVAAHHVYYLNWIFILKMFNTMFNACLNTNESLIISC